MDRERVAKAGRARKVQVRAPADLFFVAPLLAEGQLADGELLVLHPAPHRHWISLARSIEAGQAGEELFDLRYGEWARKHGLDLKL